MDERDPKAPEAGGSAPLTRRTLLLAAAGSVLPAVPTGRQVWPRPIWSRPPLHPVVAFEECVIRPPTPEEVSLATWSVAEHSLVRIVWVAGWVAGAPQT